jgi:multicomponent Na+:H+ antiporter subunit E
MNLYLWNIFLALVWAFGVGEITLGNLVVGFVLGYLILWISQPVVGPSPYFGRVGRLMGFVLFFLWELILANLRMAHDVLTLKHHMRPGVIAVPLDAETDNEITLLANFISLTPGSLSLDVSKDRKYLYIHSMFIDDLEQERQQIKDGFERKLLKVLR